MSVCILKTSSSSLSYFCAQMGASLPTSFSWGENPVNHRRHLHILQLALSKRLRTEFFGVPYVIEDLLSYADSSGVCKALNSGSDVHSVSVYVSVPVFNVSKVNRNSQQYLSLGRNALIPLVHLLLDLQGASYRFKSTWKFDEEAIADGLDFTASMSRKDRMQQLPVFFEQGERECFILF